MLGLSCVPRMSIPIPFAYTMKTRVSPRRKFYHARCRLLWLCEVWFSGITWHSERLKTISIDGRKKAKQSEKKKENRVRGRRKKRTETERIVEKKDNNNVRWAKGKRRKEARKDVK